MMVNFVLIFEVMEWKDVDVYIGGRKIEGIAECCYRFAEDDGECKFPKLESVSLSGTVKLSGKQAREIRKFMKGYKKIRLPRKMKKRLKKAEQKQIEQWLSYYFPSVIEFGRGYGKTLVVAYRKALHTKIKEHSLKWTRGMSK